MCLPHPASIDHENGIFTDVLLEYAAWFFFELSRCQILDSSDGGPKEAARQEGEERQSYRPPGQQPHSHRGQSSDEGTNRLVFMRGYEFIFSMIG